MQKSTNHELVPSHSVLSEKKLSELLVEYSITKNQLPKILTDDPMVKSLKAKVGDVIEIARTSLTAGNHKYYRVVADA